MTDTTSLVLTEHADGVCTLTLNRPDKGNALSAELVEALLAGVQQASADAAVHTLVLSTSGKHLCTGFDLSDLDTTSDAELLWRFVRIEQLLAALWQAPLRTVALARGRTWGAGADLFAACERRLAAEDATFRFPGAQFGIVLGTRRLAERVGPDAARRLVTEAQQLNATQAVTCGLASALADVDTLITTLREQLPTPAVSTATARVIRQVTRADGTDADLAALVRSAAEPGLKQRLLDYRARMKAAAGR